MCPEEKQVLPGALPLSCGPGEKPDTKRRIYDAVPLVPAWFPQHGLRTPVPPADREGGGEWEAAVEMAQLSVLPEELQK